MIKRGVTPLHLASERGHRDVLQLFLEEAPDAAASVRLLPAGVPHANALTRGLLSPNFIHFYS